jgi:hypothetical protein
MLRNSFYIKIDVFQNQYLINKKIKLNLKWWSKVKCGKICELYINSLEVKSIHQLT